MTVEGLEVLAFTDRAALRAWLTQNHAGHPGIWVRLAKARSGVASVTFQEVLEEGLCFGLSESMRRPGDETTYLQRFTPRRTKGTTSDRNRRLAERLEARAW